MQRAGGQVDVAGDVVDGQIGGQGGTQQIAHAQHHFAVAAVEHRDAAGRVLKKASKGGVVASDRQLEQVVAKAGEQGVALEARMLGVHEGIVVRMERARIREAHAVEGDAAADEPARNAVYQSQQPFEGEHACRIRWAVEMGRGFGDFELGAVAIAPHRQREIGQHDAQKTAGAGKGFVQGVSAQHAAAQKLEAADGHGLREEAESLVTELGNDAVVEHRVALYRNATGGLCKADAGGGEQWRRVMLQAIQARQHPIHETLCYRGMMAWSVAGDVAGGE